MLKYWILYFSIYNYFLSISFIFIFTDEHNVNSPSESIIANAGTDDDTADEINRVVKKRKKGYV